MTKNSHLNTILGIHSPFQEVNKCEIKTWALKSKIALQWAFRSFDLWHYQDNSSL